MDTKIIHCEWYKNLIYFVSLINKIFKMKIQFTLFLGFACTLGIYAQPQLTSDEMLPFGSFMEFYYADNYAIIDTSIQGADVTWDFSGLDDIAGEDLTVTIVDPAETAHGDDFPESNYAYHEEATSYNAYRYFLLSTEQMERVGSYYGGDVNTFTNTQEEYIFPFELGTTNIDTWDNTASGFGGGDYNLKCVGYGTLILPDVTFEDALMVRVNLTEGDIIDIWAYVWYSSENGAILLNYIDGDGFWIGDQAQYAHNVDVFVGVEEIEFSPTIKYNNPVTDLLQLSFTGQSGEGKYIIIDQLGQTVLSGDIGQGSTGLDIATHALNNGIYSVVLSAGENVQSAIRFVKL